MEEVEEADCHSSKEEECFVLVLIIMLQVVEEGDFHDQNCQEEEGCLRLVVEAHNSIINP